jgi:hypothetical protein
MGLFGRANKELTNNAEGVAPKGRLSERAMKKLIIEDVKKKELLLREVRIDEFDPRGGIIKFYSDTLTIRMTPQGVTIKKNYGPIVDAFPATKEYLDRCCKIRECVKLVCSELGDQINICQPNSCCSPPVFTSEYVHGGRPRI